MVADFFVEGSRPDQKVSRRDIWICRELPMVRVT
jgi:hypothetical protein